MSRTVRATARRRLSLLTTSSLVATSLLAGMGAITSVAFTPVSAWAADVTCNPDASGSVLGGVGPVTELCVGSGDGISYTNNVTGAGLNVNLFGVATTTNGINIVSGAGSNTTITDTITTSNIGSTSDGIALSGTTGGDTITLTQGTAILATGGSGMNLSTTSGPITVNDNGNITGSTTGVSATSTTGAISITTSGAVIGQNGQGIHVAASGAGAASVTVAAGGTVSGSGNNFGVSVASAGGGATLTVNGQIVAGGANVAGGTGTATLNANGNITYAGAGVGTAVSGATVNVTQTAGTISATGGNALQLNAGANGATINTSVGSAITSTGGNGLDVTTSGGVSGTLNGAISGSADGLHVNSTGAGKLVNLTTNGTVTGGTGDGIDITSVGGINLTTTALVSGDPGVVLVDNSATGITYNAGSVTGLLDGIDATEAASGAPVTITVATGSTVTAGNGTGIKAINTNTNGNPQVNVTLSGTAGVTATNGDGVLAQIDGVIGLAQINVGSGTITVAGSGVTGLKSVANGAGGFTGDARVTTGAGATVNVGLVGGSNDTGVSATTNDSAGAQFASVALGANNTIAVGDVAGSGNTGVSVDGATGNNVSVTAGSGLNLSVNGDASTGISATTVADSVSVTLTSGSITVTDNTNADGNSVGVKATGTTGAVTVNTGTTTISNNDGVGILATATGGPVSVTAAGNITNTNGAGILVGTTGNGAVSATLNGAASIVTTNGDGINATTTGTGGINVTTAAGTNVEADTAGFNDITAISTGLAGNVTVNANGALSRISQAGNNAIDAEIQNALSTGNVSVSTQGDGGIFPGAWATNTAIVAQTTGLGSVTVSADTTGSGEVFSAAGDGIDATINNALNNQNVSVTLGNGAGSNSNLLAGAAGVVVTSNGTGNVSATENAGSTISTVGRGIDASMTNALGGTVTVTADGAISTTGAGSQGVLAVTASFNDVTVNQASTGSITTTGALANGIEADNLTNANGAIFINPNGAISATGYGILAQSNTNDNIEVNGTNTAGTIAAGLTGISAVHGGVGGGNVKVNYQGSITAAGVYGIDAEVLAGNAAFVEVHAGNINSVNDGIRAINAGGGAVTVTTTAGTAIVSTAGNGILATAVASGPVNVDTFGNVTGKLQGIKTTTVDGPNTVHVHTVGSVVTGGTGAAIDALTTGVGSVTVTTDAGTDLESASGAGILAVASAPGGTVFVNAFGTIGKTAAVAGDGISVSTVDTDISITGVNTINALGTGIKAITGSGAVSVNTTASGTITAGTGGIDAETGAAKAVTVTTLGAVTTTTGTGIKAISAGGPVLVGISNDVSGQVGIDAETTGTGTVQVAAIGANTITATAGNGITARSVNGAITIGAGGGLQAAINATGGDGINAVASGVGNVSVLTAATGDISGNANNGIYTETHGGNLKVETFGTVGTAGNFVGAEGIYENLFGTGTSTVIAHDSIWAVGDGINVWGDGSGSGLSSVTTTAGANVTSSTLNGIYVHNAKDVTVSVDGNVTGGTNGIWAVGSGTINVTTGVTTPSVVTANNGDGIHAVSTGGGTVTVISQNGSIAAPSGFGIYASGAAAVSVNNTSAVTGLTGIHADTTGATSTVTVLGSGSVTGTAGNGIEASSIGTGAVSVGTGTGTAYSGAIQGATNGVAATGLGVVNVYVSNNVTGTGALGISATSTGAGGPVNVNAVGGTVTGGTGGILASTKNANSATVISTDAINAVTGAGIAATSDTGNVSVNQNGNVHATTFGILTSTGGTGTSNVGWFGPTVTGIFTGVTGAGSAGISATTTTGQNYIWEAADMSALSGADYGVLARTTTGEIQIKSLNNIGSPGLGNGVNVAGVSAISSGLNTVGVTVLNTGNIYVDTATGVAGIDAENAGTGTVSVTNSGLIDPAAIGIKAVGGGIVNVSTSNAVLGDLGISAVSTSTDVATTTGGAVTVLVTSGGSVLGGQGITGVGDGIDAFSKTSTGTVSVGTSGTRINGAVTGIGAGTSGIFATGLGNVDVYTNGNGVITGGSTGAGWGIKAQSTGSTVGGVGGEVTVNTVAAVKGAQGILASTTGKDVATLNNDTVTVVTGGLVTGQTGTGIVATGVNGAVSVNSSITSGVVATAVIGATNGINASSAATVASGTAGAAGTVSVTTSGSVTGTTGAAIIASATGPLGTGNVSVTANNQSVALIDTITGSTYGVNASNAGLGSTNVTTNALVVANGAASVNGLTGPVGINAVAGAGGLTVNANSSVTATAGRGIVTSSGAGGTINVASGATISGAGDATHAVVDITTASGSVTTLTNNGVITSKNASPASYADLAIKAAVGGVTVVDNGTLLGTVDFSTLTGTNAANTTVSATGNWHTTGLSNLGSTALPLGGGGTGINTLTNAGLVATSGITTFDFGGGATDKLANSGKLIDGEFTGASTLTLSHLEILTNTGRIYFGSLNAGSTSDGQINDKIIASGATLGGIGTLVMDANLSTITQSGCASLTAADCLQVAGTAALTNQAIVVTDNNAAPVGGFLGFASGIVLVQGAGPASVASLYHLDPTSSYYTTAAIPQQGVPAGVLNKPGMFFYDLANDGANELLISAPKLSAMQFAQIGAISGDTWYTTTQSWFDRQADLRDTLDGRPTGSSPAVWMKITGDWARRDSSETVNIFNKSYTYDTSYRGNTAAVIAGVDLLNVTDKDKAWVVGVQGGYVDTNERFRASATRLNLTGGVVGVYATYLQGGLFVDGIINGNILTANWNIPGLGVTAAPWIASSHVNTWGGQLEAGYAFPMGASSFIEPVGSIAYGRTTTGALTLPGSTQAFGNSDTLRGSLGARVGTTAAFQYYKVKVALEGRVWDEFDGKTNTVLSAGALFTNGNNISGVYGEIKGEANLFAVGNNLSAFVNTGIKWKTRYQDTSVALGVRYQW